jgi:hypothetical protein
MLLHEHALSVPSPWRKVPLPWNDHAKNLLAISAQEWDRV